MNAESIRVLLIEDSPTDALIVKSELAAVLSSQISVVHVEQLKEAIALLAVEKFDVALLDLSLPDSHGFETFTRLHDEASEIPIVVLSGRADEELAVKAVQAGAQDYLVKGHLADDVLARSVRYAIERQRAQDDHKLMEAQFQQAQKMDAMGTLAGGIAHDFNNILAAILGNVSLVMLDIDHEHPTWKSLTEIEKAAQRAKDIVKQILTFVRQHHPHREVLSLAPVVAGAVNLLRSMLPAGVEIVMPVTENVANIMGDSTQIHQALFNLCTNAWHALEGGPGRIEVRLENVTLDSAQSAALGGIRPGRCVCLSVRDTGKGMDEATLKRIFEPFFTTKPVGQGSGLGLAGVHGIVQNHDGAIRVASQPGLGTTFSLYFPLVQEVVTDRLPSEPSQIPLGRGRRILYVDDEEQLVDLATRWLERLGYCVSGFISPAECLKTFRESPEQFDLVITDMNMPGISGLQLATEILSVRPEVPVVLSSGYVTEELKEKAMSLGICHVIYKPSSIKELSEIINRFAVEPALS